MNIRGSSGIWRGHLNRPLLFISLLIISASAYVLGWSNIFVVEKIIIESKDKKVVQDVMAKIERSPAVIELGQPLARVDRREIATRLREMLWVENVRLDRSLLSGELRLQILPRNPIGRLVPKDSTNVETIGFLDKDLEYFYLPRETVNRAISTGEWSQMPELLLQNDSNEVRQDVARLLSELQSNSIKVERVVAKDQISISTKVMKGERRLNISWGSVEDLPLKLEILERLLELKANRLVTNVNLSNPISPIVSR